MIDRRWLVVLVIVMAAHVIVTATYIFYTELW